MFSDIKPYEGKEFLDAIERVRSNTDFIKAFLQLISSNFFTRYYKQKTMLSHLEKKLQKIKNYEDFQKEITSKIFLKVLLEDTSNGLSVDGMDNLLDTSPYLFITNHRDIVLDCALLLDALIKSNKTQCRMAIGDNLLSSSFARDLFKINGAVTVKRSLSLRDNYTEMLKLSSYFVHTILKDKKSMWVAQKSGRSKDGIDSTSSAVIKMLYMSQKSENKDFSSLINDLNIVPVAISYQYDPNDINKSREVLRLSKEGNYQKRKMEDYIAVLRGLKKYKGQIHISIGKKLEGNFNNAEEVAKEIDNYIHCNYKLFDTNWFAYDYLNSSNKNKDKYESLDQESFLNRFKPLNKELKDQSLLFYANPVISYLKCVN